MEKQELIKVILETLKENESGLINQSNYIMAVKSEYYLQVAESVVEKFNYIPCCMGEAEQLFCSCGSRKVKTTGGSQCTNNRCSL